MPTLPRPLLFGGLAALVATAVLLASAMLSRPPSLTPAEQEQYIAVGDSLTYGYGLPNPDRQSYPSLLGLHRVAVSGTCLTSKLCYDKWPGVWTWYPDALASLPEGEHTLVVLLGSNDLILGKQASAIIRQYGRVEELAEENGQQVVFGTVPPFAGAATDQERERAEVNRWIRAQASYVDYERAMAAASGGPDLTYYQADGLHFNQAGARRMADTLRDWIVSGR